jgi:hypothetical protein
MKKLLENFKQNVGQYRERFLKVDLDGNLGMKNSSKNFKQNVGQ